MKAASISVRVADFLKGYPPFEFLTQEQLVDLAKGGRVKFHEAGEIIFTAKQPRDVYLYVIQKGRVRVVEETEQGDRLIDFRGPGDLLGLNGIRSDEPYLHTARTDADTILYAIRRDPFVKMAERNPAARRYLSAYFSLNPAYHEETVVPDLGHPNIEVHSTLRKGGLFEVDGPQFIARSSLVTARPETPVREIARMLTSKLVNCVVIVNEEGHAVGKITDADLRDRVVDGCLRLDACAADVMLRDIVTAKPSDNTGKLIVRMARSGKHFLIVTEDGTPETQVLGLVTERNLFLQYGRFPTVLAEVISCAPRLSSLRLLRDRLESVILEFLADRRSMKWLMDMVGVMNRLMTQRIIELVQERMESEGKPEPEQGYCWLMMGSGGRDELLIRSAVYHALVYGDPPKAKEQEVRAYYLEMAERVGEGLRQCGFLESPQGVLAFRPEWCLSETGMQERFSELIRQPLETNVYECRDAFDFRPVRHKCPIAQRLREHIRREIDAHPAFINHMANDSLLNQPPLTIFQNYVVDDRGIQTEDLHIKRHALLPLVDVARVLAFAQPGLVGTATYKRLSAAADTMEGESKEKAALLREASEAFLVAAYARTLLGLQGGTDGAVIRPSQLPGETRHLLKTAFRTILDVLELTAERFDLHLKT